ncbi:MAG: hypothetical protein A2201_03635 [Alicyclobacillus sp. RIFOXYA1_FULL_53_8]|nr:MAG: hypothetical protein A2201_03635 [Alicyclobacillus sp. RIFOXYA1_FULL_53_8]
MSLKTPLDKATEIANKIAQSPEVKRYWQARQKMEKNVKAQGLFDDLKLKTNTSLILQQRLDVDHPKVMLADLEVQEIERKLQEIPVAMQYKEAQAEINEMLQGVVSLVLSRLSAEVPVELGPRQGCGQGHGGQGCDCGKD